MENGQSPLGNDRHGLFNSAANGDGALPPSAREQLMIGALRQGPSFVVLLLILFGIWNVAEYVITEGITTGIEQIKAGYREIQQSHDKSLHEVVSAFERERERDAAVVGLLREVVENRELLRETHSLVVRMHGEENSPPSPALKEEQP